MGMSRFMKQKVIKESLDFYRRFPFNLSWNNKRVGTFVYRIHWINRLTYIMERKSVELEISFHLSIKSRRQHVLFLKFINEANQMSSGYSQKCATVHNYGTILIGQNKRSIYVENNLDYCVFHIVLMCWYQGT